MARVYATRDQLVGYAPADVAVPVEPEATRLLTRASERVDELLLVAVYDTDSTGLPTAEKVANGIRDAACAQAVWWLTTGDELGDAAQWSTLSIGSVALGRSSGGSGAASPRYAEQAVIHLRLAGLDLA